MDVLAPRTLVEALEMKAARPEAVPIAGGTDLVVGARSVTHAVRPEVGAVGAMLYYPDGYIQHAGILTGFGSAAVNCYGGMLQGSGGYHC